MFSEILQAQVTVTGVITDVNGSPLSAAIIKSIDASTKKTLTFCNTKNDGKFSIKAKVGDLLQISAMSYKKKANSGNSRYARTNISCLKMMQKH